MQIKKSNETVIKKILKLTICLCLFLLLTQVSNVWAHASLVKSDPPRRASLTESPSQVQLWFSEEIEAAYASVVVLDSNDNNVTNNEPQAAEDDRKSVVLAVPELGPGSYKVQFRVLSVDGHVVESNYGFRIKNSQ
ncbi:MAG TPA: copper resistance protein CopC [Nitrosomonas sp.]|uniref:copper resistance CopC family protein n=1 Tax=Nitrosomonas sp. TaxID=42353 RepID=UPI000E8CEA45|nr:copper resistance CopC family protein [Nitrosomonas sp.]HBV20724.1 copper-binding protein [Nitrosomonas sp.]HNP26712.1 copper resistance protein CopC [Nitrosomonas sp.]